MVVNASRALRSMTEHGKVDRMRIEDMRQLAKIAEPVRKQN